MPERRWRRRALGLLLAALLQTLAIGQAAARVVGVVFDDSRSMARWIQSPTFGVQLLLSTLDGRDGNDRVFTLRFSELWDAFVAGNTLSRPPAGVHAGNVQDWLRGARGPVVRQEQITTENLHQRTIDDIARRWPQPVTNTPYEPIEVMLDRLTREVRDGEEAFLIIVSDGDFNDPLPDLGRLRQSYGVYRERLAAKRAKLKVDYLLIAPSSPELVRKVQDQGVRALLLEVFNGAADGSAGGLYDVIDLGRLQDALKDIIARVWSIDRAQQARLITPAGNSIGFETPLSVTRVVAVGTGLAPNPPPRPTAQPAGVLETRRLRSEMLESDAHPSLLGQRLRGDTTQLRFQPALPPGRHSVGFDRPVGQGVFLLFETAARVELAVTRPDGTPARRRGDTVLLARGEPYRLEARLLDQRGAAGPAPVDLSALARRAEVSAALETPRGPGTLALQIEPGRALASGVLNAGATGPITARAQVRLEGFVSPPSNTVAIEVVDTGVAFRQDVAPAEACPGCAPDEVQVTIAGDGQPRPVAEVTLTPTAPIDGRARLDLSGLPPGFTATWPDGTPVDPAAELPLQSGQAIRLRLSLARPERAVGGTPLRLRIAALEPLSGGAEVTARLRLVVPSAQLVHTSHSGGDPAAPLALNGQNLTGGVALLDFGLTGALKAPAPEEFETGGGGILLWYAPLRVNGYTLQLEPRSRFLCLCFLALGPQERTATLRWRHPGGLQEASASARLRVALEPTEVAWSCGTILLLLFLLLWLLLALVTTLRTHRFPRGSLAEIAEGRQMPRHIDLRGSNLTFLRSLLPWRAFRLRPPHELATVEGLLIQARSGGGNILLGRTDGDFTVVRLGESAAQMLETKPRLERVPVIWNDEIERRQHGQMLVRLLRAMPSAAQ